VSFTIHNSQSRREFVSAAAAALAFPHMGRLLAKDASPGRWRTFEVITTVEVLKPSGPTRVWVPAALSVQTPYQRTIADTFQCEGAIARKVETKTDGLKIISAEFPAGVRPFLAVTSRVKTRDWNVNFSAPAHEKKAGASELRHYLLPTKLLPTDGIVRETAIQITRQFRTDPDKARAIYEWIVENTFRNPKTRGCGIGDIRFMLESRDLGGKCADLNALFVGLARAAGVPARDTYGIRVAKSELGYVSLGAATENITKAQHCRAEVYLNDYGWTPVDPADVRKVVLEEPPGNRPLSDEKVKQTRARLFGSWEMNWIAYNFAHDVALPGSSGPTIGFLMYPQAETADGRLDCLDPDTFRYEIRAKEIRV
jgi:transglutaminase-like putative cysteine protease